MPQLDVKGEFSNHCGPFYRKWKATIVIGIVDPDRAMPHLTQEISEELSEAIADAVSPIVDKLNSP